MLTPEYPFHTEYQIARELLAAIYDAQPFAEQARFGLSEEGTGVDAPFI